MNIYFSLNYEKAYENRIFDHSPCPELGRERIKIFKKLITCFMPFKTELNFNMLCDA